jgi:ATP-dependent exoDNAse (exonuclease V) alpha subunit
MADEVSREEREHALAQLREEVRRLQARVEEFIEVGAKIIDIGDPRQITSVDVGGALEALGHTLGATTLSINHRFRDPQYADTADLLRDGNTDKALALLDAAGAVYEHSHSEVVHRRLAADWAELHDQGVEARMFAATNNAVDRLNHLARAHLVHHGALPRRARTYRGGDGSHELELRVGERVRLGRNQAIRQPDGTHVRVFNGMEGTVISTDRRSVAVRLDPRYRLEGQAEVSLPAGYLAEPDHVVHAYALTADKAQGATIDHALFAADGAGSLERGYVALSRGRWTNRVYATADTGWQDALGTPGAHTFALHQQPDPTHPAVQHLLSTTPHLAGRPLSDRAALRDAADGAAAVASRAPAVSDGRSPAVAEDAQGESRSLDPSARMTAVHTRSSSGVEPPSLAM